LRVINSDIFRKGIHGIEHNFRVLIIVRKICSIENITNDIKELLEFCAIFHDIGRINDGIDDSHGLRSIKKLNENDYFGLNALNVPLTRFIIENHCIKDNTAIANIDKYDIKNKEEATFLFKVFKDSDNLDRVRIGDFDSSYLRLPNSPKLIKFANEIYHKYTDRKLIENEILSWISSRVNW